MPATTADIMNDPIAAVLALEPEPIRARLHDLERQRQALLVLLRASLRVREGKDKEVA